MNKYVFIFLFLPFLGLAQSRNKEEAKQFIDSLRAEIVKGANFTTLAALYSEDPGSAKQGGQLLPFEKGQMVAEFENAAFKSGVGEISEVFESKFGFHFLQVTGREGEKISARHILIRFK